MTRTFKALVLGLFAVLAMSAAALFDASASTGGHFTSEVEHTTWVGEVDEPLETHLNGTSSISCEITGLHGTTSNSKTVESITLTPTYSGCKYAGFKATVNQNGCDYLLTIGVTAATDNTFHLICPANQKVEIHADAGVLGTCTITIPPQTPNGGIAYTTKLVEGKHHLLLDFTLNGLKIEKHQTKAGCEEMESSTQTITNGELTGKITLKGYDTEGKQVGVTATGSEDPKS